MALASLFRSVKLNYGPESMTFSSEESRGVIILCTLRFPFREHLPFSCIRFLSFSEDTSELIGTERNL